MDDKRKYVLKQLEKEKLIAIIRNIKIAEFLDVIEELREGGINCVEISANTTNYADMIKIAKSRGFITGAGTILKEEQFNCTSKLGVDFILSPVLDINLIKACSRHHIVSVPGAMTPTEIYEAEKNGADMVKVFPCSALGSRYIKDILAPLSGLKIMAVGGISEVNAKEFLAAGASCLGIGSLLVNRENASLHKRNTIREKAIALKAMCGGV